MRQRERGLSVGSMRCSVARTCIDRARLQQRVAESRVQLDAGNTVRTQVSSNSSSAPMPLCLVVPATLLIIFVLLYLTFSPLR